LDHDLAASQLSEYLIYDMRRS